MKRLTHSFRGAVLIVLGLGLSGFGPGSCGPEPEPCEGLDEQDCLAAEGCAPTYFQALCDCAPCAEGFDCPPCDCGGASFAGCAEERPQPPPPPSPRCEGLDERSCLADPRCEPTYLGMPCACGACPEGVECPPCDCGVSSYGGCVENPRPPAPLPCERLEEPACLSRPDCAPSYDRCGGGFAGCSSQCPGVACEMWCPNGFARDERGCEICVCAEPGCTWDGDCRSGERCVFEALPEDPNGEPGMPLGRCLPVAPECGSDGDCRAGEVCRMDPAHPCTWGTCPMHEPAPPMLCLPACAGLDERACGERPDCRGVWGSGCDESGDCTPDRTFACVEAAPVCGQEMCALWCPNGFEVDERGCPTCVCRPGCLSDADCAAGERCELPLTNCDEAGNCWPQEGACVPAGCTADGDCGAGERCLFQFEACPPGEPGCPLEGLCAPEGACLSDADCGAGQSCMFLLYDCLGEDCGPGWGTCGGEQPGCLSDADCAAGERCEPMDCDPATDCGGGGVCVPAGCLSDADCGPGQVCELWEACTALGCPPPGGACRDLGCAGLDETSCRATAGCSATYGPASSGTGMVFRGCAEL